MGPLKAVPGMRGRISSIPAQVKCSKSMQRATVAATAA